MKSGLNDQLVTLPFWAVLVLPALVWVAMAKGLPAVGTQVAMAFAAQTQVWTVLTALVCFVGWAAGASRRELLRSITSLDKLRALDWRDFEKLVAEAYRQQGWAVSENWKGGPDGGVDLDLKRGGERLVVQCKQWRTRQVPVTKVRELWGIVASEGATGGVFVTCGGYTREALDFAGGKALELVDGEQLLRLVGVASSSAVPEPSPPLPPAALAPQADAAVSAAAPACPRCGEAMVSRTAGKGANAGSRFWGCRRFPKCRGTRPS